MSSILSVNIRYTFADLFEDAYDLLLLIVVVTLTKVWESHSVQISFFEVLHDYEEASEFISQSLYHPGNVPVIAVTEHLYFS